jgi:hypothetical protein
MKTSPVQSIRVHAITLALAWIPLGICHASTVVPSTVILSRNSNDLVVTLTNPVIFTTNGAVSGSSIGFRMPDAINTAGTGGFGLSFDLANAPTLLGANPGVGLIRGGTALDITYFLPSSVSLPGGSMVTLSAGQLTLPNFFNFSVIVGIRNSEIPLISLTNSSGGARSEPTAAIPEPSAALCAIGAGLAILFLRRRRA